MKKKISIGIDLGSDTVKMVSLQNADGALSLMSVGMFSYGGDIDKLKGFMSKVKFSSKDIRVCIDDPSLKIRRLDLPQMPDEEVAEAAKWGLKDTIDGEVDEFSFRHILIDQMNVRVDNKIPLIVFAVKNKAVENLYALLRNIGMPRPKVIEPDAAALALAFDSAQGQIRDGFSVLINMGRAQSLFTVMGKKGLVYSRPLGASSETNLVEQVSRDAGLSKENAENALKAMSKGQAADTDVKVQGSASRFFSNMAIEIQRSIDGFSGMFNKAAVSRIFFCGRSVRYGTMLPAVSQALNIPVALFDPFVNIDTSLFDNEKFKDIRPMFSVACGLALD